MLESVNEVAVIVSAILAVAIGSIWYSPLLFGKLWMKAVGITEQDMEESKDKMSKMFAIAAIVNLVALFVIAEIVALVRDASISIMCIALLLTILFGAFTCSVVIWERKPVSYWLINLGYIAVIIFGGMSVIAYWPW